MQYGPGRFVVTKVKWQQLNLMSQGAQSVDVSVIIINWNTLQFLETCLESLHPSFLSHTYEVVVVDNNSSDGSQEMVRQKFPKVKLICNSSNVGFDTAITKASKQVPAATSHW